MLKNALIALLFFITTNCLAQQSYFVVIQADNNQPFYVRLNDKVLSSSDVGHLTIPQLRDSTYNVIIGFPKNNSPEQSFVITVNKKDQSFQLKNMADKGLVLFNALTMETKMPVNSENAVAKTTGMNPSKKEDAFARMMAGVVNDTAIMHEHVVEQEEQPKKTPEVTKVVKTTDIKKDSNDVAVTNDFSKKAKKGKEIAKPVETNNAIKNADAKHDSAVAATIKMDTNKITKTINQPAAFKNEKKEIKSIKTDTLSKTVAKTKTPLYRPKDTVATRKNSSFVKKISEQKTDSSLQVRYVNIPDKGPIDTVDIMISFNHEIKTTAVPKKETPQKLTEEVANKEAKIMNAKDTVASLVDSSIPTKNKPLDTIKKEEPAKMPEAPTNKNCKDFATDFDIDKLRVKMLATENDDDKISAAKTVFKLKCFSVKQVKALSEVFKTDEGRYKFFDAVYLNVSDINNFIQLQDLLSDSYYINRFKAMIR